MEVDFQILSPLIFTIFAVGFFSINAMRGNRAALVMGVSYLVCAASLLSDIILFHTGPSPARIGVTALYAITAIMFSAGLWTYYRKDAPWRMLALMGAVHMAVYTWLYFADQFWLRTFSANFGCAIILSVGLVAFKGHVTRTLDRILFALHAVNCALCVGRPIYYAYEILGPAADISFNEELYMLSLHFLIALGAVIIAMALLIRFGKDLVDELENRSLTDPLTGLLNRRGFDARVGPMLARTEDTPVCAIIGDIDHFKAVNDTFGHVAGDEVIARVGRLFGQLNGHHRYSARFGGEEFVFIGSGLTLTEAIEVADTLRRKIASLELEFGGSKASCTASFGVAQLLPGESTANLLARADASLYHSKKSGRNRVYSETDTSVAWLREAHQIMTRQAERSRGPAPFAETLNALLAR